MEEAIRIVKERDGKFSPEHKKEFCEFIGITEEEFNRIRDTFVNTDIFERDGNGEWRGDLKNRSHSNPCI